MNPQESIGTHRNPQPVASTDVTTNHVSVVQLSPLGVFWVSLGSNPQESIRIHRNPYESLGIPQSIGILWNPQEFIGIQTSLYESIGIRYWIPIGFLFGFPLDSCWIPIGFLLDPYQIPDGFLLNSSWIPIGFLLDSHWIPIGFLLDSFQIPIGFLLNSNWIPTGFLLGSYWIYLGFLLDSYWIPTRFLLDPYWISMGFRLDSDWIPFGCLWDSYWFPFGFPSDSCWFPIGFLLDSLKNVFRVACWDYIVGVRDPEYVWFVLCSAQGQSVVDSNKTATCSDPTWQSLPSRDMRTPSSALSADSLSSSSALTLRSLRFPTKLPTLPRGAFLATIIVQTQRAAGAYRLTVARHNVQPELITIITS